MEFKTQYNSRKPQPGLVCSEPPVAQSFKEECDINTVVGRILKTGVDPHA